MKVIIGYALLISVTLLTALLGVLKRKAMTGTEMNFYSMTFWFKTLINPYFIFLIVFSGILFIATLVVFSILTADKVIVMSWTLTIPAFLLTVVLNSYLLSEKFDSTKYKYILILLVSVVISIYGAWGYLRT